MEIVCLIREDNDNKDIQTGKHKEILELLEKFGFKKFLQYTTNENYNDSNCYKVVTQSKFMSLLNSGRILDCENIDNNYYGTPIPIGARQYVISITKTGYKSLNDKYGTQVIGVRFVDNIDNWVPDSELDSANLIFDESTASILIISHILKKVRSIRESYDNNKNDL